MRALLAAGLLLAGLASAPLSQVRASEATVSIDNFSFTPAILVVARGTVVTWLNRDDIPHLVLGADGTGVLKSPPLDTGDQFSATFGTPGTYPYFCSLHPHMQGTVVVQ